eukprot:scaffold3538_cov100-Skeletonema_marinoi.AAC.3
MNSVEVEVREVNDRKNPVKVRLFRDRNGENGEKTTCTQKDALTHLKYIPIPTHVNVERSHPKT